MLMLSNWGLITTIMLLTVLLRLLSGDFSVALSLSSSWGYFPAELRKMEYEETWERIKEIDDIQEQFHCNDDIQEPTGTIT